MNKTDVCILLIVVVGVIGASALFLMTPKPMYNPNPPRAIMTILDEGVDHGQSLQIQYDGKTPKATYLEQTLVFLETTELKIENVTFTDTVGDGSGDDLIVVSVTNVGTKHIELEQVNFNGVTQTGNWELTSDDNKIECGLTVTLQVTVDWTAGNKYSIRCHLTDGTVISSLFTVTA